MYRALGQNDVATLPLDTLPSYGGAVPTLPQIYNFAPQNPGLFDIPYSQISLVAPPSPSAAVQTQMAVRTPTPAPVAAALTPAQAPAVASQFTSWLNTGSNKLYLAASLGLIVVALAAKKRRR
jgi:hypothetical protein